MKYSFVFSTKKHISEKFHTFTFHSQKGCDSMELIILKTEINVSFRLVKSLLFSEYGHHVERLDILGTPG